MFYMANKFLWFDLIWGSVWLVDKIKHAFFLGAELGRQGRFLLSQKWKAQSPHPPPPPFSVIYFKGEVLLYVFFIHDVYVDWLSYFSAY